MGVQVFFQDNWENMVKNCIFESMIKSYSVNYAPLSAKYSTKLSVKVVRKGRAST